MDFSLLYVAQMTTFKPVACPPPPSVLTSHKRLTFAAAWVAALSCVLACDPDTNKPTDNPGTGCTWWYSTGSAELRNEISFQEDVRMKKDWEDLPFCYCNLYQYPVPCPTCPPMTDSVTIADALTWSIQQTTTQSFAFALKEWLIDCLTYTYTLTVAEQQSLSGTHTETTTITFARQATGCFTRYYRQVWYKKTRTGKQTAVWTYLWVPRKASGDPCGDAVKTECSEVSASGTVVWNTYPNYEWAPGQPPCGGVAITNPDPWDGKREKPCCEPLCPPPSPPALPCCGCMTHP